MGRLAGFKYRQIIKRLKKLGFEFDRQAAGSHEICYNPTTSCHTIASNHTHDTDLEGLKHTPLLIYSVLSPPKTYLHNIQMNRNQLILLENWLSNPKRKPIILRGARQVGKSTLVRMFAEQQNKELAEINLER